MCLVMFCLYSVLNLRLEARMWCGFLWEVMILSAHVVRVW